MRGRSVGSWFEAILGTPSQSINQAWRHTGVITGVWEVVGRRIIV
jgi:hypothetical protein